MNEDDFKAIKKIEENYTAYRLIKHDDPELGIVYTCELCDGLNWSNQETGAGKNISTAVNRAMHFFPPVYPADSPEQEIELLKARLKELEGDNESS